MQNLVYKSSAKLAFVPEGKLQLSKSRHAQKRPLVFYLLRSLLSAFTFLSPFFFFCWAFTRLAFGGKRFCKKFKDCEFFLKEVRVGSGTRFLLEFSGQSYTDFGVFLWSVSLNRAHLGMD